MLIYYPTLQENGIQYYGIFLIIKVFTSSAIHSFIQQVRVNGDFPYNLVPRITQIIIDF